MPFLMAFCFAIIVAQYQTNLPSGYSVAMVMGLFVLALIIHQQTAYKPIKNMAHTAAGFLLGYGWFSLHALLVMAQQLPIDLQGQTLSMTIKVTGLVINKGHYQQFTAEIIDTSETELDINHVKKVRLNFYGESKDSLPIDITPCDRLDVQVILKRPRGLVNDAGFDYEAYMLQTGLHAKGYIKALLSVDSEPGICLHRYRQEFRERLLSVLEEEQAGWLLALTIGDKSVLNPGQRQLLTQTGVAHLFVISGLHIGLIAALVYALILLIRRLGGGFLFSGDWRLAATLAAIVMAALYAMMAGFSYATIRALIAVSVFMLLSATRLHVTLWFRYFLSMAVVLCLTPLAPLSPGFVLSFFAVFILLLVMSGHYGHDRNPLIRLTGFIYIQGAIFVAMVPIGLIYFQMISYIAPFMNLWVIPLMSLIIIPLALLVAFLTLLGFDTNWMLQMVGMMLDHMFTAIVWLLIHWPVPAYQYLSVSPLVAVTLIVATLGLIMPRMLPLKPQLMIVLIAGCISLFRPQVEKKPLRVDILDVGQGTAIIIQTLHHAMVYDTGAGWPTGSLSTWVTLPVLRHLNIKQLDRVVISHNDNDHIGGLQDLIRGIPVEAVIGSTDIPGFTEAFSYCRRGQQWIWDGVVFRILHPDALDDYERNNGSCVLLIEYAGRRLLLPGDIEQVVEQSLLQQGLLKLVDVMLVPHHGSNTSSTSPFIAETQPDYAIISSGYLNRYRHPHKQVIERYQQSGANIMNTAEAGAIRVMVDENGLLTVDSARQRHPRYWHWR